MRLLGRACIEWARPDIFTSRWVGIQNMQMNTTTYRVMLDHMGTRAMIWRLYREYGGWMEDAFDMRCIRCTMWSEDYFPRVTKLF